MLLLIFLTSVNLSVIKEVLFENPLDMAWWMNLKANQRHASTDAGQKKLRGQESGSDRSVRKLLLLVYKYSIYWWEKYKNIKRLLQIISEILQTSHTFVGRVRCIVRLF